MTLEQQVTSLELSKRLKELGVDQESLFVWIQRKPESASEEPSWYIKQEGNWPAGMKLFDSVSAFTVAEVGERLPQIITFKNVVYQLFVSLGLDKQWFVVYTNVQDYEENAPFPIKICHNEADTRAKMLCYLLENKLITL